MADLKWLSGRIVVCAPAVLPALYHDDIFGACAICGGTVRFRPHAPSPRSLVCLMCFFKYAEPNDGCELTAETLDELRAVAPDVLKWKN